MKNDIKTELRGDLSDPLGNSLNHPTCVIFLGGESVHVVVKAPLISDQRTKMVLFQGQRLYN